MFLQPMYTLSQFAARLGISKFSAQTLLRNAGIKPSKLGNKFIIYSSQIKEKLPDLWESISIQEQMATLGRVVTRRR